MHRPSLSPLFQISSDLVFICSRDGRILEANPSWQRLLDFGPCEIRGRDLFSLVTFESAPKIREFLDHAYEKRSTARIQIELLDPKGIPVPFSLAGEVDGCTFIGIARPVTCEEINRTHRAHALGWKLAIEGSSAGFWDWNAETDEIYFSPRWYSMLGYEPSDLRSTPDAWNDILHPDDLGRAQQMIQDFLEGRLETYKQEVRLRTKSGEYRWILTQGTSLRDGNGRIVRMAGWHLDIHEQKIAQERLLESKDKIRAIMDAAPDLLVVIGSDYTYREVFTNNPASLIRPEAARKGKKIADVMPPGETARIEKTIDDVLRTGQTASIDVQVELPSGMAYLDARIAKGSEDEVIVVVRNVTSERALRQTQRRLLAVIDASKDFIAISSPDGHLIYMNPSLRALLGMAPGEPVADSGIDTKLYPSWARRRLYEIGIPMAVRDGVWIGESAFLNSNGNEIPISQMIVAIRDEKGDLEYLAGVSRDVSAMKDTESLLLQQQAQIASASKMAALGEMAGGIAHEINNPLAIIQAYAGRLSEMAANGEATAHEIARTADKIEATVTRISRIISGLRTISHSGRCEDFAPTTISALLDNALAPCAEKLKYLGIGLSIEGDVANTSTIECSPVQICQVLLNLIANAQHAVEDQLEKWIRVSVRERADRVEISVMDSGAGIPHEKREKIFEPFFTTKPAGVGTGLGLSISSAIMKNHGGALYLEPGAKNTCFTLILPKRLSATTAEVA